MQKTTQLLTIFQLQSALVNGAPEALALNLSEHEAMAIFSAVEVLLGTDLDHKSGIVRGLLTNEGDWQGIPC